MLTSEQMNDQNNSTETSRAEILEKVLLTGDLSSLSSEDRIKYYKAVCDSLKLNPLTKPFDYLVLKDKQQRIKTVLYATKNCTEQLRLIRNISITKIDRQIIDGLLIVEAHAIDCDGRTDVATGAVWIGSADGNIRGDELAIAYMKAETKAKRRVTLSICGLGIMDESEIDDVKSVNMDEKPIDYVGDAMKKYSKLIYESSDEEELKYQFSESWKVLKKLENRENGKAALVSIAEIYREKKEELSGRNVINCGEETHAASL